MHAFEAMGCVPRDRGAATTSRSAVKKAHRYEPDINATYSGDGRPLSAWRSSRPGPESPGTRPRSKPGVLLAERWILARLRNRRFYSLAEANAAIAELVAWLNDRPFKKMPGTRRRAVRGPGAPGHAARCRPAATSSAPGGSGVKVNIDYHIEADRHYYSVPYQLVGQRVDVRTSATTVEVFHSGRRVASHLRIYRPAAHHRPGPHARLATAATPSGHRRRIIAWAETTGPNTAALAKAIMDARTHPEQGYRSCLGIIRLGERYGAERLEAACARALAARALSYRSVESILRHGLDSQPLGRAPGAGPTAATTTCAAPSYYR